MSTSEIVMYIIISYLAICGVMAIGIIVGLFMKWFEKILV
jgi:hypothetical protein